MTRLLALLLAALTCLFAARGLAQDVTTAAVDETRACDEGRVRLDTGRCCWPGQGWSDANGRCEGAPRCPEPLVEHGDACVAPVLGAASLGDVAVVPTLDEGDSSTAPHYGNDYDVRDVRAPRGVATTESWPDAGDAPLSRPTHRVIVAHGEDEGLITAAFVVFDVGWVLGWLGAALTEATGCTSFFGGGARVACDAWPWAFIPIGGGMAAGMAGISRGNAFAFAFGIPSVILQGIGAIMSIIAFANETTELVLQPMRLGGSLSASLTIGAEASDAGLTFGLTF